MSAYFTISGKYSFTLSSSLYHSYLDATSLGENMENIGVPVEDVIKRDYGFHVKMNSTFKLAKSTSAMLHINYQSPEISFNGYSFDYLNSSISLTQHFFERRLMMSLGVRNLLDDLLEQGEYRNNLGIEYTKHVLSSSSLERMLFLSLRYRFRYGDRNTSSVGRGQAG